MGDQNNTRVLTWSIIVALGGFLFDHDGSSGHRGMEVLPGNQRKNTR